MAIKKSELYSSLWKSCDELRGGMDASQYTDHVFDRREWLNVVTNKEQLCLAKEILVSSRQTHLSSRLPLSYQLDEWLRESQRRINAHCDVDTCNGSYCSTFAKERRNPVGRAISVIYVTAQISPPRCTHDLTLCIKYDDCIATG